MNLHLKPIETVSFTQFVAVHSKASSNDLDIIINQKITNERYCDALLEKLLELATSQFSAFLKYQLDKVNDPLNWLDTFEKLICKNERIFVQHMALSRYHKLLILIEKKRDLLQCPVVLPTKTTLAKRYINAESEERYFSFYEVKKLTNSFEDDNEKILLLTKEKHEYRQSNIEFINQKLPMFDVQCSKEIKQIYELQNIKSTIEKNKPIATINPVTFNKLQFNCNVNQFVDIFYQMSCEVFVEGKPMVQGNVNDIAEMLVHTFVDKEGKEISLQSVKTILKPSREDKRPNTNKRIDLNKLLRF